MRIVTVALGNADEAYIEKNLSDGINVIYSDDNNKGKTIVVQAAMYALGNKPIFPSAFDYKDYYYYVEFEHNEEEFIVLRHGDSFVVSCGLGTHIFEDLIEFKRFWNSNIFALPEISVQGKKRIADMELYAQLFFVGQDGKDTSTIFNPGFYHKDDFKELICAFVEESKSTLSAEELSFIKSELKRKEATKRDRLKLSEFYRNTTPAKEYLSHIHDKQAFEERIQRLDELTGKISDVRKNRSRFATKKALWNNTLKELRSLNRNIEVGELRCMDCNSNHIAYKGKGKITYSFDVSTPDMRAQIISSIEDKISAYNEEIENCDYEISTLQTRMDEIMREDDVTVENVLAYRAGFLGASEIESEITKLDSEIADLKNKLESGEQQSEALKKSRNAFLTQILQRMNTIKHQIDIESKHDYDDIFTKRGTVISGSEETVYYLSRLISIAEICRHGCPIIMDSFRAEDLSTEKEERALKILSSLNCQCILTTTLKAEEKEKYAKMKMINAIDYTNHESNKVLQKSYCEEFQQLIAEMKIQIEM